MKYPNYAKSTTVTGHQPPSPVGWDQRIYQVQPGPFVFSKKTLNLSPDLFIEEIDLSEGSIRVDGNITEGRLQIGIYESENYRLLGFSGSNSISTLSYSGCLWDAVATGPSHGVTFNTGPELTQRIISEEIAQKLIKSMTNKGTYAALVLPVNAGIRRLSSAIKQVLRLVKSLDMEQIDPLQFRWIEEDLMGCATVIIDEFMESNYASPRIKHNTYHIAHKVEDTLWEDPNTQSKNIDLDHLTNELGCSRRQIQLAIEEHFGMGFVELKRLIRLHQLNTKHRSSQNKPQIADLASEHHFDHMGRFAGYYKEMFGIGAAKVKKTRSNKS